MGKIYEVCETCGKKYEESKYDGLCSKECAEKEIVVVGGSVAVCAHCGKLYLTAKKHICAL